MARRVVITGLGTVNPLAMNVRGYWDGLCNGRSGIGPIELFDASAFKVRFGGEVKGFDPGRLLDAKTARRMDRFSQFAVTAAVEALRDSGVDMEKEDPYRWGVSLGCGIGGLATFEEGHGRLLEAGPGRLSPFVIPRMMPNAGPANIAIHLGLRGPSWALRSLSQSATGSSRPRSITRRPIRAATSTSSPIPPVITGSTARYRRALGSAVITPA